MHGVPVLEVRGLGVSFSGKRILQDVSLKLQGGECKVLIGPSGGGKSTLLQSINHLVTPDSGQVLLRGREVDSSDRKALSLFRQQVGMIFQDFNLFEHLPAVGNVSLALRKVKGLGPKEATERAMAELERVGLAELAGHYPAELSGGQMQRVAIARALAMDPAVMLLDEPTSALDPELVGEVLAVIRDLARGGMTMLMATHQMDFARAVASEICFMEHGGIREQGSPAQLLVPGTRTSDFCAGLGSLEAGACPN